MSASCAKCWVNSAVETHRRVTSIPQYPRVAGLRDVRAFRARLRELHLALPCDAAPTGSAPIVGLQLTHSGRWSCPTPGRRAPRVAFRHPLLDRRTVVDGDGAVLTDDEVRALIGDFARAAYRAQEEGFDFVDLK